VTSSHKARTPDAQTNRATQGYEHLADGSIHSESDGPPTGFFVRGRIDAQRFIPQGEVQGEGKLATAGHPGWVELSDGAFYGDETAREPGRPYVRGYRTPAGRFVPSSKEVVY